VKNDILNFNPDANDQIRRKLMNVREIFIPRRDDNFEKMIDEMVDLHHEKVKFRKRNIDNDSSLSDIASESSMFMNERNLVGDVMKTKKYY